MNAAGRTGVEMCILRKLQRDYNRFKKIYVKSVRHHHNVTQPETFRPTTVFPRLSCTVCKWVLTKLLKIEEENNYIIVFWYR